MMYYLNEDKTYQKCSVQEWSDQFENINRHLGNDFVGNYHISTVWLGIDHNHFGGIPLLFETMVFDEKTHGNDIYMERYSTWQQAIEGHQKAILWVTNNCKHETINKVIIK